MLESQEIYEYSELYSLLIEFDELLPIECWNEVFMYCVEHIHWNSGGGETTFRQVCAIRNSGYRVIDALRLPMRVESFIPHLSQFSKEQLVEFLNLRHGSSSGDQQVSLYMFVLWVLETEFNNNDSQNFTT